MLHPNNVDVMMCYTLTTDKRDIYHCKVGAQNMFCMQCTVYRQQVFECRFVAEIDDAVVILVLFLFLLCLFERMHTQCFESHSSARIYTMHAFCVLDRFGISFWSTCGLDLWKEPS